MVVLSFQPVQFRVNSTTTNCFEQKYKYGRQENDGWFKYDYERFVDVSKRVMQGRSRPQQQQVVREVLLSMLPPGAPAQVSLF